MNNVEDFDNSAEVDSIPIDEYYELLESGGALIEDFINKNIMIFIEKDFEKIIYTHVFENLKSQFLYYNELINDNIDEVIKDIVDETMDIYFKHVAPNRCNGPTYILDKDEIRYDKNVLKNTLDYLKSIPQEPQRTPGWYEFRYKHFTASSIWKAYSTPSNQNQLIYSKCKPFDATKYSGFVNINSPLHWGQKFEEVSVKWYEVNYNTKIDEFGCIPHKDIKYLAASPDGINTDINSPRYGRMLEIKNIFNREIDGKPKKEYWVQMQIQMEVCDLDECDFLETRFKEYETFEDFEKDGTFTKTEDGRDKGVFMMFQNSEGKPYYIYPEYGISEDCFEEWEQKMMEENKDNTWIQNIYWHLDEVSCVLVLRNRLWFNKTKHILDETWETVIRERVTGYEHRAPKRRIKRNKDKENIIVKKTGCIIDIKRSNTPPTPAAIDDEVDELDVTDISNAFEIPIVHKQKEEFENKPREKISKKKNKNTKKVIIFDLETTKLND